MSRWEMYNPNPENRGREDCAVRAIAKALGIGWDEAYTLLTAKGFKMKDMPHANAVWGAVLKERGFTRHTLPNICPDCYTAEDFAEAHPEGVYVLGFGNHTATIRNGRIYDSWDSSKELPQFYWTKGEKKNGNV